MNEHETHEAVVKLARRELEDHERINCWFRPEFVRALIDRLEAAHKREIEATAAKCCQLGRLAGYGASEIKHQQEPVGNAAKLREALIKAITMLAVCEWPDGTNMEGVEELRRDIDAALDVPPRNCDVGTAEEQAKRLREFCKKHRDGVRRCSRCPVERIFPKDCTLAWAQMPYEEGVPNAE